MNSHVVWIFLAQTLNFFASFRLLASMKIDKGHVHARFEKFRVERKRLAERFARFLVIASFAEALERAVNVTAP